MTPTPLVTVLGATGTAGAAIVRALLDAGQTVRGVSRGGDANADDHPRAAQLHAMSADITDPADTIRAVRGSDVVVMAAQPAYSRWAQELMPMIDDVVAACRTVGAKLVMVDNLYAHGPVDGAIREDSPQRPSDRKSRVRAAVQQRLMEAHRTGEARVTIGRASDFLGHDAPGSAINALAIEPATRARGALRWLGSLDQPHSAAHLPDIARALLVLATDDRADGQVWNLPHAPGVTGRQFLSMVNASLDQPRPVRRIPPTMLRLAAPFHTESRESLGIIHQWTQPFVVDDSRFHATFGPFSVTPLADAIAASVHGSTTAQGDPQTVVASSPRIAR